MTNMIKLSFDEQRRFHFSVALLPFYMRSSDHFTMGIPVEHRFPLLDYRLVEFGLSLPISYLFRNGWTKYILRKAMEPYLPAKIIWRRQKMGFQFPYHALFSRQCPNISPLRWRNVTDHSLSCVHKKGTAIYFKKDPVLLWRLISIGIWQKGLQVMNFVFVVDAFPSVSETFILNQITGLIDLGHEVVIFSAARPDDRDFHDDIRKYDLLKKTYYYNDRDSNKFTRVLWGLLLIIRYGYRNPRVVLNSLNFFKYGKEALSLNYLYKAMLFLAIGKIDIIFCHYGPNGNFAALMKELGIEGKLVTMFHGYDIRRGIEGEAPYTPLFSGRGIVI